MRTKLPNPGLFSLKSAMSTAAEIATVLARISNELERGLPFENSHGITHANIQLFRITPVLVTIDPDDCERTPRGMWLILHSPDPEGYWIAFDPATDSWCVAEQVNGSWIAVVWGDTLSDALTSM